MRVFVFLTFLSFFYIQVSLGQTSVVKTISETEAEASVLLFAEVNDYQKGTGKPREEVIPSGILEFCAATRINQNWLLTTGYCGNAFDNAFKNSVRIQPFAHALDTDFLIKVFRPGNIRGVGYITPSSNIIFNDENNNQATLALIGIEAAQNAKSLPISELNQSYTDFALINFSVRGYSSSCGELTLNAVPSLVTLQRNAPTSSTTSLSLVSGVPVFANEGGSFQIIGVYDQTFTCCNDGTNTCGCFRPLNQNNVKWLDGVIQGEFALLSSTLTDEQLSFSESCSSTPWIDRPLWETAQGGVLMVGIPLVTALIGVIMGCTAGCFCKRRPSPAVSSMEMK